MGPGALGTPAFLAHRGGGPSLYQSLPRGLGRQHGNKIKFKQPNPTSKLFITVSYPNGTKCEFRANVHFEVVRNLPRPWIWRAVSYNLSECLPPSLSHSLARSRSRSDRSHAMASTSCAICKQPLREDVAESLGCAHTFHAHLCPCLLPLVQSLHPV